MNPSPPDTAPDLPVPTDQSSVLTVPRAIGATLPQVLPPEALAPTGPQQLVGATLGGRYHILRLIASGGMGSVYETHDNALDRRAALKTVHLGQQVPPDARERFRREALAAAQLDHPNIVAVYDIGEENGLQFFTMALIDGQSLQQFVRDHGPRQPTEAVQLMLPIVEAVGYAHERQFIHRDLKPDNVLIDSHGRPRVTDFGLARHLLQPGDLTGPGELLGTPRYMAPEQARNQQSAIGPATDVYGLGGILGFLLSGRPPITGESLTAILFNVIEKAPSLPRDGNERVPEKLNDICRRCLAKKPEDRFASAAELAAALRRFVVEEAPLSMSPSTPRSSGRGKIWVLAAATVAVVAIGGWALLGGKGRTTVGEVAQQSPPLTTTPSGTGSAPLAPSGGEPVIGIKGDPVPIKTEMSPTVQALVKQLKDESAGVRATAAETLGKLGPESRSAVPAIIERIKDDVWTIDGLTRDNSSDNTSKDAAVGALQALAPGEVEGAVLGAMESKNERVKSWASAKLGELAKNSPKHKVTPGAMSPRVAALVKQLKDENARVRHSAATVLGELGEEALPAVPALVERIKDDVWTIAGLTQDNSSNNTSKDAALAALKKLAKEKVEAALAAATESKNATVRVWAAAKFADQNK